MLQADVLAELFRYSDVHQRVGFRQMLFAQLGQELMAVIANAGVLGLPPDALAVTLETAMQLAPDTIAFLATEAAQHDLGDRSDRCFLRALPDIIEHLRAGVLVQIMRRLAYQWARNNLGPLNVANLSPADVTL